MLIRKKTNKGELKYQLRCNNCGKVTEESNSSLRLQVVAMKEGWKANKGKHYCTKECAIR